MSIDRTEDGMDGEASSDTCAYLFKKVVHENLTSWRGIVASASAGTTDNSSKDQSHTEPPHPDFGDGANPLWSLFSKQAKTQDEARIQSLAGDMDGVLVFVRLSPHILSAPNLWTCISTGWLIFCGPYFLPCPKYSGIATEPCAAISVLPATVVGDASPNFPTNGIHRPASFHPIHSPTSLPITQPIIL
jgi:hypothetical protein